MDCMLIAYYCNVSRTYVLILPIFVYACEYIIYVVDDEDLFLPFVINKEALCRPLYIQRRSIVVFMVYLLY